MNKNNRKEYLYSVALKLFLTKRYEAVSITDIEKATGMTRGAISYYGKDKIGLFYNVVKHFLIDQQNLDYKMRNQQPDSLQEFIEEYIESSRLTLESLRDIDRSITNGSRGYMALILQICDFFPDLNEQYITNRNKELLRWIDIINMAIRQKEIRQDIDVIATSKSFMNVFYGQSFLDALSVGLNIMELKIQYQNLYNILKT